MIAPAHKRAFTGKVVSDRMTKTRVVVVTSKKTHPKYKKQYTVSQRFKVHDEANATHVGDVVRFVECRPISKDKRWRIV
ncbi:30S ribosomal protein S17 [Candidatus Uhrbacteria bacterium]|nr:30S ribosomal protein S17 [Candidatus Uhrbacteria bacterium]